MSEIQHAQGMRKGETSPERRTDAWLGSGRGGFVWTSGACEVWTAHYSTRDPDRIDITRAGCDRLRREKKPAPGELLAPSAALVFPALRALKAARTDGDREQIWTGYKASYCAEIEKNARRRAEELDALLSRRRIVLVCFCVDHRRCHRSLAGPFLAERGAVYRGEVAP